MRTPVTHLYDKANTSQAVWDESSGLFVVEKASLVLPNETGYGIKVGGQEGDDAWPWRDITSEVRTRGVGATDPAWTQIGATVFSGYVFALNDVCWMHYHIPHDYVPGSDVHLHIHWFVDGTDTETVKWQWEYVYAKGFNQEAFAFASATTVTAEEAPPGTAYQHMVTETVAITIADMEVDGHIMTKITRLSNGGSDNADDVFMIEGDCHYQSTNVGTIDKAPDFWTAA